MLYAHIIIEFILSYMTGFKSVYNNYVKPRPFTPLI